MNPKALFILGSLVVFCMISCQEKPSEAINQPSQLELEKAAILEVLNNETKAAFNRDYEQWKTHWLHESFVTKSYMNFSDSTMTETLGWEEVDHFVKTYIEEHPEPVPLPTLLEDIDVRLYGSGAWVSYKQNDPEYGLKKETRLMEKEDGVWKIAGMYTTIYGFQTKE
jgi:hypothetical protein